MPNPTPIARSVAVGEQNVAMGANLAAATPISFAQFSAMAFTTPAGGAATITWYASNAINGTYTPVRYNNGSAVTTTISGSTTYLAPAELFPLPFIKGVSDAGTFNVTVMMKG